MCEFGQIKKIMYTLLEREYLSNNNLNNYLKMLHCKKILFVNGTKDNSSKLIT